MDKNQGDQPLSSEDLLRRAREGLGSGDDAPEKPADFTIESYTPPVADPTPPADVPMSEPDFVDPVVDTPAPSEPASWAPPPAEPTPDPVWSASAPPPSGPAPETVKKSGGGLSGKLWILVVLVVAGFALFSFMDTSKTVDEIAVGDCLDLPEDDVFFEVDPIECTEAHDLEVFALVDLSVVSADFSMAASYPGDTAVYDAAYEACWDAFEPYIGVPYEESRLYMDAFTPTLEGWDEVDDRIANCVVFQVNADASDIEKSTYSLKDIGR